MRGRGGQSTGTWQKSGETMMMIEHVLSHSKLHFYLSHLSLPFSRSSAWSWCLINNSLYSIFPLVMMRKESNKVMMGIGIVVKFASLWVAALSDLINDKVFFLLFWWFATAVVDCSFAAVEWLLVDENMWLEAGRTFTFIAEEANLVDCNINWCHMDILHNYVWNGKFANLQWRINYKTQSK